MIELFQSEYVQNLGITGFALGLCFYLFLKMFNRVMDDAKERDNQNREVQSKVADAINNLADSHRVQERVIREALYDVGKRDSSRRQAKRESEV